MNTVTAKKTSTRPLSYLFALWEGGGNVPPTLAVIRRLIAAGHQVTLLGDPCQEEDVATTGAKFIPWTTAPRRLDKLAASDHLRDWEVSNPADLIGRLRDNLFFGPAERYARDVTAQLNRTPADCVVTSDMLFGPAIAAEAAGIPCVFLAANVFLYPRPGVPPFGPGFPPATNEAERKLHQEISAFSEMAFGEATVSYNSARAAFGLPALSHPFEQLESVDGIVVLSSESFDFPSAVPNRRLVFAGPELDDPHWAGEWSAPWQGNDKRPLVLVGLSSTFQDQTALLGRIVRALSELDVRAVVTTGPAIDPEAIPKSPNCYICQTAPHSQLLKDSALMITHCGHGSVMRGLAAEVPLLCIPMGRDQNDNAARVTHRGAGLRLTMDATEEQIAAGVRTLLTDPSYRKNASQLGTRLRRDYENSTAVAYLERFATRGSENSTAREAAL